MLLDLATSEVPRLTFSQDGNAFLMTSRADISS